MLGPSLPSLAKSKLVPPSGTQIPWLMTSSLSLLVGLSKNIIPLQNAKDGLLADLTMTMKKFLDRMREHKDKEVLYLQSQNDNLHAELYDLLQDATSDLPFASEAFGALPDVANVWIGDDRSVTSVHKGKA